MNLLGNEGRQEIARMGGHEPWYRKEQQQVESQLADNLDGFEKSEFQSLLLISETGKKDGRYRIQGKDSSNIDYHSGISLITHR